MIRSVLAVALAFVVVSRPVGAAEPADPAKTALALVGGVAVTEADLEALIGPDLTELRQREAQLREQALDEAISSRLLENEAKTRGITRDALLQAEVLSQVSVTPEEVKAFYEANKARIGGLAEQEALQRIEPVLRQQKARQREMTFVRDLRKKIGVKILLEPTRAQVTAVGPSRGPANAPVTLIEFSDFQCPYCERVQPALRQVFATYGDKVRLVYRDFPLEMHPDAGRAAAAATCAGEQGKFWEMHENIFSNQTALAAQRLSLYAGEIGVDSVKFEACMAEPRHAKALEASMAEAESLGVRGTPAFFINGRMLVGAQPFEAFARIIDDELARAGAVPEVASTTKPN
jgi:protein-disulfide isomerase